MLKLLKIFVLSSVVSFAAFSNDNDKVVTDTDAQGLELGENSDYFFGGIIDTVKKAFSGAANFVKNLGNKALGKILNAVGMGSCSETKKAIDPDGVMSKSDEKDALKELIKTGQCGTKADCDALQGVINDCY